MGEPEMSLEDHAREEKIRRHLQNPEYWGEEIFERSNTVCEGGCEEFMKVEEEEAGWGMCMSCKFEAMK